MPTKRKTKGRGSASSKIVPQSVIDRLQAIEIEIVTIQNRIRRGGITDHTKKTLETKLRTI